MTLGFLGGIGIGIMGTCFVMLGVVIYAMKKRKRQNSREVKE